jgi:hypothetical protein
MRTGSSINPCETAHGKDDGKQSRRRTLYGFVFADDSEKDTIQVGYDSRRYGIPVTLMEIERKVSKASLCRHASARVFPCCDD